MDLKAVGQRIKSAREAKNLTQEELAALVNLSPTHVSVIERGLKVTKLDTFVAIVAGLIIFPACFAFSPARIFIVQYVL